MTRHAYLRTRLTSPSNLVVLALTGVMACAAPATTNSGSGGSNGSGGNNNKGGSNGSGGSNSSGGSNGSGGSSAKGGSNGSGGSVSSGGSNGSGGSSSTGGAAGSGSRACGAPASGDVVADFEEGFNQDVVQGGRQGWWSAFGDTTGTQTPAAGTTAPVAAAMTSSPLPSGDTCDMYALHSTATGHSGTSAYTGFGAAFDAVLPPPSSTTAKTKNPYDVSAYDGISFNIKSGSGTAPPIWVEFQNTENVPTPDGTAKYSGVDQYNTRGMLLTGVASSWQKVYVPFGILAPRYLPNATESDCSNSSVVCQAPPWDSKNTLYIQFGVYPQFAAQPFTSSTSLNYDLWVDDVTLYKGANGLTSFTPGMLPADGASLGSCTKPAGASIKYLTDMYAKWKATFVTPCGGNCVMRPENANDVVSEGIGYGMLIAVNMNDKTLFDALWSYEQQHKAAGNLMTWCLGSAKSGGMGSVCNASGGGSATDADEDMAFALLVADKQWPGGSYKSTATSLIGDIWSHDIDTASMLPTYGSNAGGSTTSSPTNPSYFAPAYYRAFASVDSGHGWTTVASNCYTAISKVANSSTGLAPAWCTNNCSAAGSGGKYQDDNVYQYDAHRVPWRMGIDACWNGTTSGNTVLTNNAKFFANQSNAGIGRVYDIYTLSGTVNGNEAAVNSMSAIGTAGVGAMAVGNSFASKAYQFLLDASYSPASVIPDSSGRISYSYFNATVGLLTALTMSGNFNH